MPLMRAFKIASVALLSVALLSAALCAPNVFAEAPPSAGKAAYEKACKGCHGGGMGGMMTGAPKSGSDALKARLTRAGSVDALVSNTSRGVGKMRAQGGKTGMPDADIRAAIDWMLANPP